jgi:Rrf2 family iron-sulfur cluster assembly transcriptional regulator
LVKYSGNILTVFIEDTTVRLTTKGRYAVSAMLDLAFHSQVKPVTLTEIAARQTISLSYLEQLFARLRRAGIVKGARGPGGGYKLCRKASAINISEIISAVDEPLDSTKCGGEANCQKDQTCLTHDLWMGLSEQIKTYLVGISLADLLEKNQVQAVAKRQYQDAQQIIEIYRHPE